MFSDSGNIYLLKIYQIIRATSHLIYSFSHCKNCYDHSRVIFTVVENNNKQFRLIKMVETPVLKAAVYRLYVPCKILSCIFAI